MEVGLMKELLISWKQDVSSKEFFS